MQIINKKEALDRLSKLEGEAKALHNIIDAPESIFDRVQDMDSLFREAGEDPNDKAYKLIPGMTPRQVSRIRHARVDLLNEVFRPQELSLTDKWHYPVYWRPGTSVNPGSGFSLHAVYYVRAHSGVGARLSQFDEKTVKHLDKYFHDEITGYLENRPA